MLVPPAVVMFPLASLFLDQVELLSPAQWRLLLLFAALIYGIGGAAAAFLLRGPLREVADAAAADSPSLPEALSRALRATVRSSQLLWLGFGAIFAVVTTLAIAPSVLDVRHYLTAALIVAAPASAWAYGAGKRALLHESSAASNVAYVGRGFSVARKVATLFIGFFVISALALVQLISSKVSFTLEDLALASTRDSFERVTAAAGDGGDLTPAGLRSLSSLAPRGHVLFLMDTKGRIAPQSVVLTEAEKRRILEQGTGDSAGFYAPTVLHFQRLANGPVLGMLVPWEPYAGIPRQIARDAFAIAGLTALLFAGAVLFLSSDLRRPLRQLRQFSSELAQGDFSRDLRIFADDETGQLAASFLETRDNLRRLLARVGGSGSAITQGVQVITGGTGELLSSARRQSELTLHSNRSLEEMRSGIGNVVTAAQTVTELTQDTSSRALQLQAASEEIARSMEHLFSSVEKTSGSITQISAAANEMSRRAETLSGIGDEVLSFVSEMESTIEELRKTAGTTAEISQEVREAAVSGGEAVRKTVEGIGLSRGMTASTANLLEQLQGSTDRISRILNVIEEITEQTNLLAINASIIAAQSGEEGRAFTVVAGEIRELAERTRGSTKEISGIIRAVQSESKESVAAIGEALERANENVLLASEASTSLLQIFESAERSSEMATRISASLEDQARASRHLHEVSSRMSDQIAQIRRGTREQASGTELLADEAEKVREIALRVRGSTDEQSTATRGITLAMEQMAVDARAIRDLIEQQLKNTDSIAGASGTMLEIARGNDSVARQFNEAIGSLLRSGEEFQAEVRRFRLES